MTKKRRFAIVLLVGVAIGIACGIGGFTQLDGALTAGSPQHVPGRFQVSLGSGQWEIYQLTGTTAGTSVGGISATFTKEQPPSLTAAMVTVTAADGRELPVQNHSADTTETLQRGSDIFTGVATFQAPGAGKYSLSVAGPGAAAIVVGRPVRAIFTMLLPWFGGGLVGGLCVLVGLIGVIVAHRRKVEQVRI
jgi:hypothetical protein